MSVPCEGRTSLQGDLPLLPQDPGLCPLQGQTAGRLREMLKCRGAWGGDIRPQEGPRWGLDGSCHVSGAEGSCRLHLPSQGPPAPPLPVPPVTPLPTPEPANRVVSQ